MKTRAPESGAPGLPAEVQPSGPPALEFTAGKDKVSLWNDVGGETVYVVHDDRDRSSGPRRASKLVYLAGDTVDPLMLKGLAPPKANPGQHIVQLRTQTLPAYKEQIEKLGGRVVGYLPDNAYLVRANGPAIEAVGKLPFVRSTLAMPQQFKLDTTFRKDTDDASAGNRIPVVISVSGHEQLEAVAKDLTEMGLTNLRFGHDTIVAEGNAKQIGDAARHDDVLWIGPDSEASDDLDNARIVGGADALDRRTTRFQGQGQRAHILEGIERDHPGFAANEHRQAPIAIGSPAPDSHGHATAGIVFGYNPGVSHPGAIGIVPFAQGYYTNRNSMVSAPPGSREPGSRWAITKEAITEHNIDAQTASWGHQPTTKYDERSRELDGILEETDLVVTQSQSNTGSPQSRPQAWAKNVISVTALYHYDNTNFDDDRWGHGSSTRDGADPRIGRTLHGFYDKIATTAPRGGYRLDFNGTSGGTPIVNGYMHRVLQMFKEGVFTEALLDPSAFQAGQHPHASTAAALAIASARQHPFTGRTAENNRYRQGWGFPDVDRLYEKRDRMFIVNENDKLQSFETARYSVDVQAGEPELKISMVYKEPPALVSAGRALVNDLDLKVTAPDGTVYLGNSGLLDGIYSVPGGDPDRVDAVESVFVQKPQAGRWTIEVVGQAINQPVAGDPKASFALVALGAKRAAE